MDFTVADYIKVREKVKIVIQYATYYSKDLTVAEKALNLYAIGDKFQCSLIKGGFDTAKIIQIKEVKKKGKTSIQYSLSYSNGKVKRLSDAGITDRLKQGLWQKIG